MRAASRILAGAILLMAACPAQAGPSFEDRAKLVFAQTPGSESVFSTTPRTSSYAHIASGMTCNEAETLLRLSRFVLDTAPQETTPRAGCYYEQLDNDRVRSFMTIYVSKAGLTLEAAAARSRKEFEASVDDLRPDDNGITPETQLPPMPAELRGLVQGQPAFAWATYHIPGASYTAKIASLKLTIYRGWLIEVRTVLPSYRIPTDVYPAELIAETGETAFRHAFETVRAPAAP